MTRSLIEPGFWTGPGRTGHRGGEPAALDRRPRGGSRARMLGSRCPL